MTRTDGPIISEGQNNRKIQLITQFQRGPGEFHYVQGMNQIRLISFKLWSQEFNYVRIVILGTRRVGSPAQIVMQLDNGNAVVLSVYSFVIDRIKRRRLNMRNHPHRMSGALRADGQTMCIDFRAANVAGQVLMCEISDLQMNGLRLTRVLPNMVK